MCLAVPGRIISITDRDGTLMSVVDFAVIDVVADWMRQLAKRWDSG